MKVTKPVKHVKKYEEELEKFTNFIIASVFERMRNNTLEKMNKSTIEKFEKYSDDIQNKKIEKQIEKQTQDAKQIGDYATIFLRFATQAEKKLNKQFDDNRIEKETKRILLKADRYYKEKTYKYIEDAIGIPFNQLISQEAMKPTTNALILETSEWVKQLKDKAIDSFTANSLRVMAHEADFDDVIKEAKDNAKKFKNDSSFVARNQMANFQSTMNKIRHQNLGFTKAQWQTSKDERVRKSHEDRQGKIYDIGEGLYSSIDGKYLSPGIDPNCRCNARYIYEVDNNE